MMIWTTLHSTKKIEETKLQKMSRLNIGQYQLCFLIRDTMNEKANAIPVPVSSKTAILLRPNTSSRKKYSEKIKIIMAIR